MRWFLAATLIFIGGQVLAQEGPVSGEVAVYISGEELAKNCRSYLAIQRAGGVSNSPANAYQAGTCSGFVVGIVEGLQWAADRAAQYDVKMGSFCLGFASTSSIVESVAIWLDEHPQQRTSAGYVLTRRALSEKFPC